MAAGLVCLLLGIPLTVYFLDDIQRRRARKMALKSWARVRQYFVEELETAVLNFLLAISYQKGWGCSAPH